MSLSVSERMARGEALPDRCRAGARHRAARAGPRHHQSRCRRARFRHAAAHQGRCGCGNRDGETKYTPIDGTMALKQAISAKFERDNGLRLRAIAEILVSCGAKQCLFNLCLALLSPQATRRLFPRPTGCRTRTWFVWRVPHPVIIDTGIEDDFKITPRQLAECNQRQDPTADPQ